MSEPDPTLEFLRGLDTPGKYVVRKNVPIFTPNERVVPVKDDDGKPLKDQNGRVKTKKIVVDADTLKEICDKANDRERKKRVVGCLKLGHTKMDPNTPEREQPPVVGYQRNLRVGEFDGEPCIRVDLYYLPEHYDEAKTYPFRSVEYYHNRREITGLALLRRDPELDMGMMGYAKQYACSPGTFVLNHTGGDGCLLYQREVNMPDTITDPKKDEIPLPKKEQVPPGASPKPQDMDPNGDEEQNYSRHCANMARYMDERPDEHSKRLGFMGDRLKDDPDYQAYAAGPGFAGPTSASNPGAVAGDTELEPDRKDEYDAEKEVANMQRRQLPEHYQKLRDDLTAERRAAAETEIQYMREAGYMVDDQDVEDLAVLTPDKRTAAVARMKKIRAKAPMAPTRAVPRPTDQTQYQRGSQVGVSSRRVEGGHAQGTTAEQRDAAVRLSTQLDISYDDALNKVKGG